MLTYGATDEGVEEESVDDAGESFKLGDGLGTGRRAGMAPMTGGKMD